MFKLLAIRPLPGCENWIKKCLHIDMMYYFCKDYVINESRKFIERTSKNIEPLKDDFFSHNPVINISAVVGMNGDGKSSLIELMIRLINNCAFDYQLFNKENSLRRVKGVKAELFYLVDNVIYRMVEKNDQKKTTIWRIADLTDKNKIEWEINEIEIIDILENSKAFFFTIVSNYSHYAYNIYDYQHEWETIGNEDNDDEKCWIHYLFHINDIYQTPITLHPYRKEGNIEINREKDLSRQRLLSLFLNAPHPQKQPNSYRRLNNKDAEYLALTELSYSKLQDKYLIDFFKAVQSKEKLDVILNQIEIVDNEESDEKERIEFKMLMDDILPKEFEIPLIEIMLQDDFLSFVKSVINRIDLTDTRSDIREVIYRLNALSSKYQNNNSELQRGRYVKNKRSGVLLKINAAQLGRLDTIYRITKHLKKDLSIVSKDYKDLTLNDKCNHYIIYEILSIINTYPRYKNLAGNGDNHNVFKEYDERLEQCIDKILEDSDTHVVRKIRQVENFINKIKGDVGLYERICEKVNVSNNILVSIDKLQNEYQGKIIKLDELPPPIYEWTILFKKKGEETCNIELDYFSSGEKQMLYSLSSIIYQLQILDNTSTTIYPNVNLILEEIELYYHPEFQRKIIKRLLELLRGLNLQHIRNVNIIFITHSPFILSDVPKCNVMFLQDGMANDVMQENTFGANIHSLLKNGFFLPNLPIGEFAFQKIETLFALLNSGDFNPETDLEDIYQHILLVGEPFLRNQLLSLYNAYKR